MHILTSGMSYDYFERLVKKAKGKSFTQLLSDYKRYWKDTDESASQMKERDSAGIVPAFGANSSRFLAPFEGRI